jgi:hypothetical protein
MGRISGEPMSLYPGWGMSFEKRICEWAKDNTSIEIYTSLLSVISPQNWDCDHKEQYEWFKAAIMNGSYSLEQDVKKKKYLYDAEPQTMLKALILIEETGGVSWISYNRVSHNDVESSKCIGGLSMLVLLQAIKPSEGWKDRHFRGEKFSEILRTFYTAAKKYGYLSWDLPETIEILKMAKSSIDTDRTEWINKNKLGNMISKNLTKRRRSHSSKVEAATV